MIGKKTPAKPVAIRGLSPQEVEKSRKTHGSNELTQKKRNGFLKQFLASFGDPIIKILLAALAINVIFLFRDFNWYETAGIAVAIFLATFVSTLSEYGSESAFIKLQEDAQKILCRVKRLGGIQSVPMGEIVVGDLVLLQAGERVPADGVVVSGELHIDQSALNGESKEITKRPGFDLPEDFDLMSLNQVFRGSIVCAGEGVVQIRRVGDATFYGDMAREMQEETRESPLKVRLAGLAKIISRLGYCAAALVAFADLFHSFVMDNGFDMVRMAMLFSDWPAVLSHLLHALTLAITVVVVAVPEGLPMMITVVLSSNMRRMLKDQVLVRKLVGIETSGSLNILFTDKTGTLTKGKLAVSQFVFGDGKEPKKVGGIKSCKGLYELLELNCVYNSGSVVSDGKALGGNATDRALLNFALPLSKNTQGYTTLETVPFDSAHKFSAAHIKGKQDLILIKGAPERIVSACTRYYDEKGRVRPLLDKSPVRHKWNEMTQNAVRVLALAVSDTPVTEKGEFKNLCLIGLAGIRDEIRPEAKGAIKEVQGAGVQVVMITGDNKETATAIARECGLIGAHSQGAVLTSSEMAAMDDGQLKGVLRNIRVVARALPTDKSRLVRLSQEMGLVAGMTGDGINDAPALKKADVGFAMGAGTEVAKEAGDIVILDNNFASIVKAILYGRTIFKSIRKFIVFQLTMNLCAVGVSIIGPFIGIDTPVTVIQMLWINIIMDTLAGLAFAGEPPLREYMKEAPKRRDEPVLNSYMLNQIVCMGLFTICLCVAFLKLPSIAGLFRPSGDSIYLMTAFFALFIFCGVFNSFNARTHRLNLLSHISRNKSFLVIMLAVVAVQLLLIYFGGSLFRTAGLTTKELQTVLWLSFLVVPADLLRKIFLRLAHKKGDL